MAENAQHAYYSEKAQWARFAEEAAFAERSNTTTHATTADYATEAGHAVEADHALSADEADEANHADTATTASSADTVIDNAITTAKIADAAVTLAKLAAGLPFKPGPSPDLLGVANGASANIAYTASYIVTSDGAGHFQRATAWNATLNTAATGANGLDTGVLAASTWYYVYAITQPGGTKAVIASLSAAGPLLPSGYDKWTLISAFRTDATANKYPLSMKQAQGYVQYVVAAGSNVPNLPIAASGAAGNVLTPTWVAVAMGSFVPLAVAPIVRVVLTSPTNAGSIAAPNASYGALGSGTNPPPLGGNLPPGATGTNMVAEMLLETSNIYWAGSSVGCSIAVAGWRMSI